jgi:ribosomal-protein-alanine N-acetyltransferase
MLKEVDALCDGIETITLEVRASNKPAQGLYRKFGFAPVGLRRGYYQADNEDAIVMTIENLQGRFLADRLSEIELELSLAVLEM